MAHIPDLQASWSHEPLPLGLSLANGRALVTLARPVSSGPLVLEQLELEITGVQLRSSRPEGALRDEAAQFPFDLSGGSHRFHNRRCRLTRATVSLDAGAAMAWLSDRPAFESPVRSVVLGFNDGGMHVTGRLTLGDQSAPFLLRGPLQPCDDRIRVSFCDLWLFGPLPVAAPLAAGQVQQALGARRDRDSHAQLVHCCDLLCDPLGLALRILPLHGWRLPSRRETRLARVDLSASCLRLHYDVDAGPPPPAPERWQAFLLGRQRMDQAEQLMEHHPDQAIQSFEQQLDHESTRPHAEQRLLELLCVQPDRDAETLEVARRALVRDPLFVPALMARAAVMLRQQRPKEAAEDYRRVADLCSAAGDSIGQTMALLAAGHSAASVEPSHARQDFERALDIDARNTTAINQLSRIYAEAGEWDRLAALRQRQLQLATTAEQRLHTHLALGEVYRVHLSDPSRALTQYQRALEIDPECEPALKGQAEACIDADRPQEAIEVLERLSSMGAAPGSRVAVHLRLASLHEHLQEPDRALAQLQVALTLRPEDPQCLRRVAALREQMGQRTEAIDVLERLLAQETDGSVQVPIQLQIAELLLAMDQLEAAGQQIDRALELDPDNSAAHRLAVSLAERSDGPRALLTALERALEVEPSVERMVDLLVRLAHQHAEDDVEEGEGLERAAEAMSRAVEQGLPAQRLAHEWDRLLKRQQEHNGADGTARLAELAAATFTDSQSRGDRFFAAGQLWEKEVGSSDQATRCYLAAVESSSQHSGALDALEAICTRQGNREQLVRILGLKAEASKRRPSVHNALLCRLGELLAALGRSEEAHVAYSRALAQDAEHATALVFLAREAMTGELHSEAEELYRRLASILSRGSADMPAEQRGNLLVEAHLALATLHHRENRQREEEGHLEMALAISPRHAGVLERLDALLSKQQRTSELADVLKRRRELASSPEQVAELELRRAVLLETIVGRGEDAAAAYRAVLRVRPSDTEAHDHLCRLLRDLRHFGELFDALTQRAELLEERHDEQPAGSLWLEAARLASTRLGDRERASACLRRALKLAPADPDLVDALLQLGVDPGDELDQKTLLEVARHHRRQEQIDPALRALRAAVALPGSGAARATTAREIVELLWDRAASPRVPLPYPAAPRQGREDRHAAPQGREERDPAVAADDDLLLDALDVLHREDAAPVERWWLAQLRARRGELDQAVAVLELLPHDFEAADDAQALLLECLQRLGRHRELAESLEHRADTTLLDNPPVRVSTLVAAARVWVEQADDDERALDAFVRATRIEPLDLALIDRAAELLLAHAPDRFAALIDRLLTNGGHTPAMQATVQCRAAAAARRMGAPWDSVEDRLNDALRRDPGCLAAIDGLIALYTERAHDERLIPTLLRRASLGDDPAARADALVQAADVLNQRLQRPAEALELLRRAARLRPESHEIQARQADLLLVLGELDAAESLLVALAGHGHEPESCLQRARGLAQLRGDTDAEVRCLQKLADLHPEDPQALAALSSALGALGEMERQAAVLEQLGSIDDSALLEAARLHAGPLQQPRAAQDALQRLLDLRPDHPKAMRLMLKLSCQLEQNARAMECLQRLRRVEERPLLRAELSSEVARHLEASGDGEIAEKAWRMALEDAPDDGDLIRQLADNLQRRQQWQALAEMLQHALTRCAGGSPRLLAEIHTLLGETYLDSLDDWQSGVQHLQQAYVLWQGERALDRLLQFHRLRQDHTEIAELLEGAATRASPQQRFQMLEELAELQEVHLKDLRAAARTCVAAYRCREDDLRCAVRAQELFVRTNELDDALALLDEVIPRASGQLRGELHASRARILAIRGLTTEAVCEYKQALEHHPDNHCARAELGRRLFELGQYDAAVPHLQAAAEKLERPTEQATCAFLAQRAVEKLGLASDNRNSAVTRDMSGSAASPEQLTRVTRPMASLDRAAADPPGEGRAPLEDPAREPDLPEARVVDGQAARVPPVAHPVLDRPPADATAAPMGDQQWEALAERYRAEAVTHADPDQRTRLLIRAALIIEKHLDRPLEAYKVYEEAAATSPDDQTATEALADAAYRNQNWHRARELYDRLWIEGSTLPRHEISYRRGLVYETLGDEQTADLCYAHAISLKPDHRASLEGKARVALNLDDLPGGIEALEGLARLITVDEIEELTATRAKLGELYLRAEDLHAARDCLESALSLDPNQRKVMQTLLAVYQQLKEYRPMVELLERLVARTSNPLVRASLLHYSAEILGGSLGKEEAAVDCLLKAYDLAPHYPPTLWRLIDYYWERDDLPSVAEMGANLRHSTSLLEEIPDMRHVRLAVAALAVDQDRKMAADLLNVALGREELVRPTLVELAHALQTGLCGDALVQLIRAADVEGRLATEAPLLLADQPDVAGLSQLVRVLSGPES